MSESDTVISRAFTGKTLRAIANATTKEWEGKPTLPFMAQVANSVRHNLLGPISGIMDVDADTQCLAAGQGGGAITEVLSCAEIVRRTMAQAEATIARLGRG